MTYKLIALDLDGTLKSTDKQILPKTKAILQELAKRGVVIVLASGRPTAGLYMEADELKLNETGGYLLSFNGAKVVDYQTKEIIYQKVYNEKTAHHVYDRAKEYDLAVMTYVDEMIITEDIDDEYVIIESEINHLPIKPVKDFKEAVNFSVNKVLLTGKPEYVENIIDEFKQPYGNSLSIYRSAPFFIEVMAQGIDKAASLEALIKRLGMKREEVISFGDGYNDISMIKFAGMGVAMDNAVDQVKQCADYITLSNDEEGIYECLKLLNEKGEI
ncbi:Cof-type HAD-IIB family hydrolase [Thomasclavelia sp.]